MSDDRGASKAIALLALLVASAAAQADRYDRRVEIINDTSVVMFSFYASRTTTDDWQEDIFGESVLMPGESGIADIDDGTGACMFDFAAVFADGDIVTREDFNVCKQQSWRVYE